MDLEDLHNKEIELDKPKLIDIYTEDNDPNWPKTGSLPKDFFSKLVHHSAELVQLEEGDPDIYRDDVVSAAEKEDLEKEIIDLPTLWRKREESKSRTTSDAPKPMFSIPEILQPKSRTTSDAPKPIFTIPEILQPKSRSTSDAPKPIFSIPEIIQPKKLRSTSDAGTATPIPIRRSSSTRRRSETKKKFNISKKDTLLNVPVSRFGSQTTDDTARDEETWVPDENQSDHPRYRTTSDVTSTKSKFKKDDNNPTLSKSSEKKN
jgi:hypothetical protein